MQILCIFNLAWQLDRSDFKYEIHLSMPADLQKAAFLTGLENSVDSISDKEAGGMRARSEKTLTSSRGEAITSCKQWQLPKTAAVLLEIFVFHIKSIK